MLKTAVLVSGSGTNFQAIIDKKNEGYFSDNIELSVCISSKKNAGALKRAKDNNIDNVVVERRAFDSIDKYDEELINILESYNIDLVVMAGFLAILGKKFVSHYKNKIINVHPSLIPSFCGKGYYGIIPHRKALEYGVKVTGATVHFVELETDAGPIILQKAIKVKQDDNEITLQKRVMEKCEWKLLPKAIKLISENRIEIDNRRVIIK